LGKGIKKIKKNKNLMGTSIIKQQMDKRIEKLKEITNSEELAIARCIYIAKTMQDDVKAGKEVSQYQIDRYEQELNILIEKHGMAAVEKVMAATITYPVCKNLMVEYEEGKKKGLKNLSVERHPHLLDLSGFSRERIEGSMHRQIFYATKMGGVPRNHSETFEKKGWMMPYIFSCEYLFWGRYDWWHHILDEVYTIEEAGPIPQLSWCTDQSIIRNVQAMLSDCVNYGIRYGCTLDDFAEWILWAMDATEQHPDIPMEVNERWYRTLAFDLLIKFPHDYMTWLLVEFNSKDVQEERDVAAEVPDFNQIVIDLKKEMEGKDPEELKMMEFYEPEVGCGTYLLPYSNYTLFAEGSVEDPLAMKLNKIQRVLYAPWFAYNPYRHERKLRNMLNAIRQLMPGGEGTALVMNGEEDTMGIFKLEGSEEKEA
jgi:hypothetical protein